MSWILSSNELLDAYAQCDSFPTEVNKVKLYIITLKTTTNLSTIKFAVNKLKQMHENNTIPKELLTDAYYYLARGAFVLTDWSSALFFCEMVLERKKQHMEAKELMDHARRKLEKQEALKMSTMEASKSTPVTNAKKQKVTRRGWIFGKFTPNPQAPSPLLMKEIESYAKLVDYLKKKGISRFSDTEVKHFTYVFNNLVRKNINMEGDICLDQISLSKALKHWCHDSVEVDLPKFLFNGFCRYIDETILTFEQIVDEVDDENDPNEKASSLQRNNTIVDSEGIPISSSLGSNGSIGSPKSYETQEMEGLDNNISTQAQNSEPTTPVVQESIIPLIGTSAKGGLTKDYFLFVLSTMIYGTVEEKLHLSYCCFDSTCRGYIEEEHVTNIVKEVFYTLSNVGIQVGNPSNICQKMWESLSKNVESAPARLTKEEFVVCGKNHYSMLLGLTQMLPDPSAPNPKARGIRTLFGDREWDTTMDIQLAFRIASQMINSQFLSNRTLFSEDFQTQLRFTLPRRNQGAAVEVVVYAPHVFSHIREICGIPDSEFYYSFGMERCLGGLLMGELSTLSHQLSDGRSGATFYYTSDGCYIIKMIPASESRNFLTSLPEYFAHIRDNPDSFLCRFLASIQLNNSYYIIMKNIFSTNNQIHEIYDLKGSILARSNKAGPVYKDNDLQYTFNVGPEMAQKLRAILTKDVTHLQQQKFTDYSLLVGVHNIEKEESVDKSNITNTNDIGYQSIDGTRRFYFGIIDTFTTFNLSKRMEKGLKTIGNAGRSSDISSQSSNDFAKRFCDRIINHLIE